MSRQHQFNFRGKKIFYRTEGRGSSVLLLHGFGEDSSFWNTLLNLPHTGLIENPALKGRFSFIVPDLPGSGKSEMTEDMSMEGMADTLYAIVQNEPAAAGKKFTIIGHSMGGYIGLALLEKYPELVSAFGLFHSTAFADTEEKRASRQKGIEFMQQHGAFEFLKTIVPNLFSEYTRKQNPELIQAYIRQQHFLPLPLTRYSEAMMRRPDRSGLLAKAAVPVLFIIGAEDQAVPVTDQLTQCHLPEISYIHMLQKSAHMGMLEEAVESSKILERFLSGTSNFQQ